MIAIVSISGRRRDPGKIGTTYPRVTIIPALNSTFHKRTEKFNNVDSEEGVEFFSCSRCRLLLLLKGASEIDNGKIR
jgi:hypothetical protein